LFRPWVKSQDHHDVSDVLDVVARSEEKFDATSNLPTTLRMLPHLASLKTSTGTVHVAQPSVATTVKAFDSSMYSSASSNYDHSTGSTQAANSALSSHTVSDPASCQTLEFPSVFDYTTPSGVTASPTTKNVLPSVFDFQFDDKLRVKQFPTVFDYDLSSTPLPSVFDYSFSDSDDEDDYGISRVHFPGADFDMAQESRYILSLYILLSTGQLIHVFNLDTHVNKPRLYALMIMMTTGIVA
jgi:hypothetical protein